MITCAAVLHAQSSPSKPPVPGAPAGVTAFVGVSVVPMNTERVLANQTVLIQRGWIVALGSSGTVPVPAGAVRIDGQDKYLIPGLADMHAHIGISQAAALFDSVAIKHRLFLWLANGLTTVRNMDHASKPYFTVSGEELLRLRARAAVGELWSPRIYTAGPLSGLDGGALLLKDVVPAVTAYKAAGYDFIKPYSVYKHGDVFDSLAATARRVGLPLAGHVEHVTTTERALETYRSIEHLFAYEDVLSRSRIRVDTAKMKAWADATRRAGVWNCPTQYNEILNGGGKIRPVVALRGQFIKALQDAGAGLLLGSDRLQHPHKSSFPVWAKNLGTMDISLSDSKLDLESLFDVLYGDASATHRELEVLVQQVGLTPYQALAMGTRNVATYFGTLDESGTVAVGKRADLVLLSSNPLADIRHTRQQAGVMLGGRWLPRAELDRRVAAIKASLRPRCDSLATVLGRPPCE